MHRYVMCLRKDTCFLYKSLDSVLHFTWKHAIPVLFVKEQQYEMYPFLRQTDIQYLPKSEPHVFKSLHHRSWFLYACIWKHLLEEGFGKCIQKVLNSPLWGQEWYTLPNAYTDVRKCSNLLSILVSHAYLVIIY